MKVYFWMPWARFTIFTFLEKARESRVDYRLLASFGGRYALVLLRETKGEYYDEVIKQADCVLRDAQERNNND